MIQDPSINIMTRDVERLTSFYQRVGFKETFRTPREGAPTHVEVTLDHFTIGVSSVEAAIKDHGLNPSLDGRPVAILLWTDDSDREYARLLSEGAQPLRPPHDFRPELRTAWVTDPDGNPINLAQRRTAQTEM
ncbi:MAG TPA: VOC family protein [Thermoplasmata archaeon]|nr:VOC family protein [Thermoplasmata archaeon]